jgi:hypothetical protein
LSNPQFSGAHQMLAVTYIELGRSEDAKWAVAELLTISSNFTLSTEKARSPYKNNAVLARYIINFAKLELSDKLEIINPVLTSNCDQKRSFIYPNIVLVTTRLP